MALPTIIFLLGLLFAIFAISGVECIGVCYGRMGNNLPPPNEVVSLYKSNGITGMRIYDPSHDVLNALRGSNLDLILGVPNDDIQKMTDAGQATAWVQNNVVRFWPAVRIKYIAVGNEVSPIFNAGQAKNVLPALVNIFNAVRSAGLHESIKVSTAIDTTLIGTSYPPSEGAFRGDVRWFIDPIVGHLVWAKTPLLTNIYTYFGYKGNPRDISLPYATFAAQNVAFMDQGRAYKNLFDAILDGLYAALERNWGGSLDVVVSESGWPSAGDFGATHDNAKAYVSNFIRHVKGGSPKRPNKPIEAYVFAMFNENLKNGGETEKNFGLFFPNKTPKYNIAFGASTNDDCCIVSGERNSTTLEVGMSDM